MPRARIPYDDIEQAIRDAYPYPLYSSVRIATVFTDRVRRATPTRVYDRSTGNFAGIGWRVPIVGLIYQGQDQRFAPIYENFEEDRVFIL